MLMPKKQRFIKISLRDTYYTTSEQKKNNYALHCTLATQFVYKYTINIASLNVTMSQAPTPTATGGQFNMKI